MNARLALLVIAIASSCTDDVDGVGATFAHETFCPDARVQVTSIPELALEPRTFTLSTVAPWHEPVLPPDVASDPDRKRLWMAKRDADHARWLRQSDPRTSAIAARSGENPIFEVTGCGNARLYSCHGQRVPSCFPVAAEPASLVCKNGGTIHVSREAAITCAPAEHGSDPNACALGCPRSTECTRACGANDATCEVTCAADEISCQLGCATVAREQCEASGLTLFDLCKRLATEEQMWRGNSKQLTDEQTKMDHMVTRRTRLDAAVSAEQTCTTSCRAATDSRALATCLLACTTTALERCQGDEPQSTWCDGFRAQERALRQQLQP